ncbi:c-type cytochrome [Vulgatibacter sp.]|uniref:cytochrome c oxidase subunit II n=1 Tax=Vulgatibacter sp. TaxID=1971226 RepID=UPI0035630E19
MLEPEAAHRIRLRRAAALPFLGAALLLCGCDGIQSTLAPAGVGAKRIATLFWISVVGAAAIWLAVMALTLVAIRRGNARGEGRRIADETRGPAAWIIVGGGAVFPSVVLAGYLLYGLALLPDLVAPAPHGSLQIQISGEMWWWRVHYLPPGGDPVPLANEIRLPVGEPVEFLVESPDVIHSFWIPSLGPKIDMIPGRKNRLALQPTTTGLFRGACAEYCGASDARMNFYAEVMEKAAFERWLAQQAAPAKEPSTALEARGRALFLGNGCGACHTVRGTEADGVLGPDLTHVGGRHSIGAGLLPNDREGFARFIASTNHLKPEVRMPAFGMLPADDLTAIAAWLDGLE